MNHARILTQMRAGGRECVSVRVRAHISLRTYASELGAQSGQQGCEARTNKDGNHGDSWRA
eukprot:3109214-Pleurochrysis_carterae.AAC.2